AGPAAATAGFSSSRSPARAPARSPGPTAAPWRPICSTAACAAGRPRPRSGSTRLCPAPNWATSRRERRGEPPPGRGARRGRDFSRPPRGEPGWSCAGPGRGAAGSPPARGRRLPPAARGRGHPPAFPPPASRGAPPMAPATPHRPVPGRRYVHVRPVAGPAGLHPRVRRPRRRVGFALILTGSSPQLRVRLRLSERQGQEPAGQLTPVAPGKPGLPGALAMGQEIYAATLPGRIVSRLTQRGLEPDATRGAAFADKVVAGVTSALSTTLQERPHLIASAVQDPADGITVTITFRGVTRESLGNPL